MAEKSKLRYTEIDGVETTDIENFPYSAIKALGAVQIGLGVTCLVLGLLDIFLYLFLDDESVLAGDTTLTTLTIASSPIWCGLWFSVAGCMAACMNKRNKSNLNYFKMTFLVLSILCSALFAPVCCILNIVMAILRHELEPDSYRWMVPILIAFFSFNELIFAIASASICCCCAPIRTTQIRVVMARQVTDSKMNSVGASGREKSTDSLEIFTTTDRHGNPLKAPLPKDKKEELQPVDPPNVVNPPKISNKKPPDENDYRPITKESSYEKMKRLVLPSASMPRTEEIEPRDQF
ncbi:uncharacterized protein LOC133179191 [Saccostrea echinata]|uniref:uncharacterized protein LOC133179191 n=1 Tax=Saccostrea echinata TaxID=191078 RepID=UPI002A81092D|nr:uncharacterized protein LOC133179191 [Saccostrea echinata]